MTTVACAGCGTQVDPAVAILGDDGKPICDSCESDQMVAGGFDKVLGGYAAGALGAGLFSVCFNPLFLLSIAALLAAVGGTFAIIQSADIRESAKRKPWFPVMMGLGAAAALVQPALFMLQVLVSAATGY